jgi:three-Cys-motif partner protein
VPGPIIQRLQLVTRLCGSCCGRRASAAPTVFASGPGRDVNPDTGEEFDGSPLIALKVRPPFHKLYLGDAEVENVTALRQRIPPADLSRIDLDVADCHDRVKKVVEALSRGTLGLAFVDPEGFDVKSDIFRQFARGPIDVLFLFPTSGITRNLRLFARREESPLDRLIQGWRELPMAKRAAGKRLTLAEEARFQKSMVGEFRSRMHTLGFVQQDRDDPALLGPKRAIMFHLMLFSRHKAGLTIWKEVKKVGPDKQRLLDLTYPDEV